MPSYNPNKRCCEEKVGLDELLPSMEALETVPISPQYPHSQPASSGKLVFRSIRNLASVSRSNFLMESWTVLFLEKWHPPSFHPLYFSPSTWTEGGREGGWFTSWKGVTGKPGILPVSAGCGHELSWAAWNISRQVSGTWL